MKANDAKDYLPLVQALAEGKIIQEYCGGVWNDDDHPSFLSPPAYYRIKPEPREVWILRYVDGHNSDIAYASKGGCEYGRGDGWSAVRYREVIE